MSTVGEKGAKTQKRVVEFFLDMLGYMYLGYWKYHDGSSNIEREKLTGWLERQGHSDKIMGKVLHAVDRARELIPQWRCETVGLWVEFAKRDQAGTKLGLSRHQLAVVRKCLSPQGIRDLMALAGRGNRTKFRDQVLSPLLEAGLIEMTLPHKPRSPQQKYRLTMRGRAVLDNIDRENQSP